MPFLARYLKISAWEYPNESLPPIAFHRAYLCLQVKTTCLKNKAKTFSDFVSSDGSDP
jgi:hypothetical protein